jgi:hypothetical protein
MMKVNITNYEKPNSCFIRASSWIRAIRWLPRIETIPVHTGLYGHKLEITRLSPVIAGYRLLDYIRNT